MSKLNQIMNLNSLVKETVGRHCEFSFAANELHFDVGAIKTGSGIAGARGARCEMHSIIATPDMIGGTFGSETMPFPLDTKQNNIS